MHSPQGEFYPVIRSPNTIQLRMNELSQIRDGLIRRGAEVGATYRYGYIPQTREGVLQSLQRQYHGNFGNILPRIADRISLFAGAYVTAEELYAIANWGAEGTDLEHDRRQISGAYMPQDREGQFVFGRELDDQMYNPRYMDSFYNLLGIPNPLRNTTVQPVIVFEGILNAEGSQLLSSPNLPEERTADGGQSRIAQPRAYTDTERLLLSRHLLTEVAIRIQSSGLTGDALRLEAVRLWGEFIRNNKTLAENYVDASFRQSEVFGRIIALEQALRENVDRIIDQRMNDLQDSAIESGRKVSDTERRSAISHQEWNNFGRTNRRLAEQTIIEMDTMNRPNAYPYLRQFFRQRSL